VQDLGGQRPVIAYPCHWSYRVVCTDEGELRREVLRLVGASEHSLERIGQSSSGRYQRLELRVLVLDEAQRNAIFAGLGRVAGVHFVL
jgi:putative lipoic acid-binding regulatory protein